MIDTEVLDSLNGGEWSSVGGLAKALKRRPKDVLEAVERLKIADHVRTRRSLTRAPGGARSQILHGAYTDVSLKPDVKVVDQAMYAMVKVGQASRIA